MLSLLVPAAVALGFAWIMYYAVGAVATSFKTGLGALVITYLITTALSGSEGLQIGINIYPEDMVCTVIFLAAIARYLMNFKFLQWKRFIAWFAMLICLSSFGRGIFAAGLRDAGVLFRSTYYTFAVLLYVLSFDIREEEWRDILWAIRWATVGIMAIAMVRWALVGVGFASPESFEAEEVGAEAGLRVVSSFCALIVAECFLVESFYIKQRKQTRWNRLAPLLLLISIILLQHRTIWVGIIPSIFWLAFKDKNFRRYAFVILTIASLGLMAILTTNVAPTIKDALTTSAASDGTLLWRFSSWRATFDNWQNSDQLSHLIGVPFGVSNERVLASGELTDRASHGYFFDVLFRLGGIGLATVLVILAEAFHRSVKNLVEKGPGENDSRIMIALMILIMCYSITYGLDYFQMIIIGAAMAYHPLPQEAEKTSGTLVMQYSA